MPWQWPSDPPAYVFAEDAIGIDQQNILRVVYREAYDANGPAIEASALLRAYAKAVLTALVLHVLCAKLRQYIQLVDAPSLSAGERTILSNGVIFLRNRVSTGAEPNRLAFVRSLARHVTQAISLFQQGTPAADDLSYRTLSNLPIHRIPADVNLATSSIRELAAALAVLGTGEASGLWTVRPTNPAEPQQGSLGLISIIGVTRVFFAANQRASVQLGLNGLVATDSADAILIHGTSPISKAVRSPMSVPGRVGKPARRDIGMSDLLSESTSTAHLLQRFREEAIL
jgi:hypothetical protein